MLKSINFDMDGTIADLYAVDGWLDSIHAESPAPYLNAAPIYDIQELNKCLRVLQAQGWTINIITWLARDSSNSYKTAVRKAKLEWLTKNAFVYDHFHAVQYGATKADSVRKNTEYGILIDDDARVRKGWNLGITVNPTETNIIDFLKDLAQVG